MPSSTPNPTEGLVFPLTAEARDLTTVAPHRSATDVGAAGLRIAPTRVASDWIGPTLLAVLFTMLVAALVALSGGGGWQVW